MIWVPSHPGSCIIRLFQTLGIGELRILITGASGSGTTTLGKSISEIADWQMVDTDDYYWHPTIPPYTKKREKRLRNSMLLQTLDQGDSVVSGNITHWGVELEGSFDLIVFLYLDTSIRISRLRTREQRELGKVDEDFIQWASEYDEAPSYGRSLAKHEEWLSTRTCPVLRIEGDSTVVERTSLVITQLKRIGYSWEHWITPSLLDSFQPQTMTYRMCSRPD